MSGEDRWLERLDSLNRAMAKLDEACAKEEYTELERAGLIQTFEFSFELAWKTLRDKLYHAGYDLNSPRATLKQAFRDGMIEEIDEWLRALDSRNLFTHAYNESMAREAVALIKESFHPMLIALVQRLNAEKGSE